MESSERPEEESKVKGRGGWGKGGGGGGVKTTKRWNIINDLKDPRKARVYFSGFTYEISVKCNKRSVSKRKRTLAVKLLKVNI